MPDSLFICPHCGNKAPHKVVFKHNYKGQWYSPDGAPDEQPPTSYYTGYACATCKDLSIYETHDYAEFDDLPLLVFPADTTLDDSVPALVAANYIEAKRVQTASPNAFAVLIRRALEAVCDDRGAAKGNLRTRLESLAKKGEIPPILAEITSVLRVLGNSGAHNTEQKVVAPMTWKIDKFFRTLVEYVYVAPALLEDYRKSLTKKSKGKAEK